ncbi:Asp23/Gls24 family envelope stress response protein [Rhodocaloribacter litoris]|uniref:Asp23/Gls24 family envelope stress response protein n=1 Tax=Rhodocaloribacter litoris TaxID=2558931 RepID=UPI001422C5EA|nr:Asp23/Gls24 family envelope stress response protein [Rhodocaloribacter litoris]QXD16855.1 Asp23/Gls24 family envelope stress response protein [Rhodocaloribacter litoris]GIV60488.1 MAG: hypothetical protein KatS3mg043_1577 [Rhodothermaceae bacterium]
MATATKNKETDVAPAKKTSVNAIEGASVTQDESGQTIIRNQVVAKIASLAVREIEGVHRLVPFGATQSVVSLAKTVTGGTMRDLGVQVEVGTREAAIDVRIVVDYGVSIPAIAEAIRRNVAERVEEMTGLKVVEINIDVVDLYFGEEEEEVEEAAEPRVH